MLALLREWAMSVFAQRMGTSATGASLVLGGTFSFGQTTAISQGVRDKITSAANRSGFLFKSMASSHCYIMHTTFGLLFLKYNILPLLPN